MLSPALQTRIDAAAALLNISSTAYGKLVLATSLGVEDQVVAHLAALHAPRVQFFTLDTGRLHPETLDLIQATERFLKRRIEVYFPQAQAVQQFVQYHGINGFYESITQRKQCCEARKLEPLKRALAGQDAWITGLRREQAPTRGELQEVAHDAAFGLDKISPLASWSEDDVWAYARHFSVPTNPLHERGFRSIGCAPCTRATAAHEDVRAGRWWWETPEQKECGLHAMPMRPAPQTTASLEPATV